MFRPIPISATGVSLARRLPLKADQNYREAEMMWSFFVASLVLWAFGVVSSHTFGGRIHLLLGVAIGVVVIRMIQGHRDPLV